LYKPNPNLIYSIHKSETRIEIVHFCITADLWAANRPTVTDNCRPAELYACPCVNPGELFLEE
jgi:hypothetical protein